MGITIHIRYVFITHIIICKVRGCGETSENKVQFDWMLSGYGESCPTIS